MTPRLTLAEPMLQEVSACCVRSAYASGCRVLLFTLASLIILLCTSVPCTRGAPGADGDQAASMSMSAAIQYKSGVPSDCVTTSSGVQMPRLIYGTAFHGKHNASIDALVLRAVRVGFLGLETGGSVTGEDLAKLWASGIPRESLFIQAKISPQITEAEMSITENMDLLIATSLSGLGLEYVDSLILYVPDHGHQETMQAWRAMEDAVRIGWARQLGIANVKSIVELHRIYTDATIKPSVVQQYFGEEMWYERELRAWCNETGTHLQSYWTPTLLEENRAIKSSVMQSLAQKYRVEPPLMLLRFLMGLGDVPVISTGLVEEYFAARRILLKSQDARTIYEFLKRGARDEEAGKDGQEERMCRYCRDGDESGPLMSPCKCSGGQGFVHLECLRMWQRSVLQSGNYGNVQKKQQTCELCKAEFNCRPPSHSELSDWQEEKTAGEGLAKALVAAAQSGDSKRAMGILQAMSAEDRGESFAEKVLCAEGNYQQCYNTPLHFAAYKGDDYMVRVLLEAAPQVLHHGMLLAKNRFGNTPLHDAVVEGHRSTAKLLIDAASEMLRRDVLLVANGWGDTVLHTAVSFAHDSTARNLLKASSKTLQEEMLLFKNKSDNDNTPLHVAALRGHESTARVLLEAASESLRREALLSKDASGSTPFHIASSKGHESTAKVLLDAASEKVRRELLKDKKRR